MQIEINATIHSLGGSNLNLPCDVYQIKVIKDTVSDTESATEAIKTIITALTSKPE
jgi:hypothetical protein